MAEAVDATVVIVTKDRREILRAALESVARQTVSPELVVLDDGSADGTSEMVRSHYPAARFFRSDESRGQAPRRTEAARFASGSVLVFLDDDVLLPSSETLERTLAEFDHPRIGAVAIPYHDADVPPRLRQQAPASAPAFATFPFGAGACAVRRDVFLAVGGYPADLVAEGEETDYCLRMLAAGYITRLGSAPPLDHLGSPPYDIDRKVRHGRRNEVLYAWRNVPMPYLPVRALKLLARAAIVAARYRQPAPAARGLRDGVRDLLRDPGQRAPVSRAVYRVAHLLKARGAVPLDEIESRLPDPSVG